MISQIELFVTETFMSLRRHPTMAFAAITCVASALFIAGLVGLLFLNARFAVRNMEERVRFNVFFHRETTREEARKAFSRLQRVSGVESVQFVPKERAWEKIENDFQELGSLLGENPLPDMVVVKATELHEIPALVKRLKTWPEVDSIRDVPEISVMLESISRGVSRVGLILGIILTLLSLVIIHHTIELTLYARRREIFIMSLVGATPVTVAMPFVLEGIIYGMLGGGIALGCVAGLYAYFTESARATFGAVLYQDHDTLLYFGLILVVAGMVLGLAGSLVSVVKFLNRPRSKQTNA